ncbi:VTT domain-containing protein [Streptomyces sp. HSW2009]|uniref:DedA family protein n=1 Tax=Streptomyces sp. HSW2009 TaxID=3142890 RepID=UPI0032EB456A
MLETLGSLVDTPWIYVIIGASVVLDVFLPVLPSGILVVAAATAAAGTTTADAVNAARGVKPDADIPEMLALVLCATTASVLGDMVAYRLAWRGGERLDRAIARSRRLTSAQQKLGAARARGGGALVVLARFAPAGRSVVSLGAGAAHRKVAEFLPWSALAGLMWAGYSVGLGYLGGQWLGATWLSTAVSVLALVAVGTIAGFVMSRRPNKRKAPQPS